MTEGSTLKETHETVKVTVEQRSGNMDDKETVSQKTRSDRPRTPKYSKTSLQEELTDPANLREVHAYMKHV